MKGSCRMWLLADLFFPLLAFLTFTPRDTDSCTASGVCGTNPYCGGPPPQIGGGYRHAPPPTCPSAGCGGTYGCGPYGCYRMRARGSTSFQPSSGSSSSSALQLIHSKKKDFGPSSLDEFEQERKELIGSSEPLQELEELAAAAPSIATIRRSPTKPVNPNRAFMECCLDRHLPDACLHKCHFGVYNKDALTKMYFKQDGCPLEAMREIQFCAAQGRDHRECCVRNGVTTTIAGEKCLTFCDQRPGKVVQLDLSYIPCFDHFESMKSCFWNDIARLYRS